MEGMPAKLDAKVESAWIDRLRPEFARFGATPPTQLTEIYRSFVEYDDMLATLSEQRGGASTTRLANLQKEAKRRL